MKKIRLMTMIVAFAALSVPSLRAAIAQAQEDEPVPGLVNPPLVPPPLPSGGGGDGGGSWAPQGWKPVKVLLVGLGAEIVIYMAEQTIDAELREHIYQENLIHDPMDPTLPPGYVGSTYDDDLYSHTPYLDYYWYYSPLNPQNWPGFGSD